MYVCMYACMYACMYVCMYAYIYKRWEFWKATILCMPCGALRKKQEGESTRCAQPASCSRAIASSACGITPARIKRAVCCHGTKTKKKIITQQGRRRPAGKE